MSEEIILIGKIVGVSTTSGSGKDSWTRGSIKIGADTVSTFDTNDIETANRLNGQMVSVKYVMNKNFKNLVKGSLKAHNESDRAVLEEEKIGETNNYPEAKPGERPAGAEVTQPPTKDMGRVSDFKVTEGNMYDMAAAKKSATTIYAEMMRQETKGFSQSAYESMVSKLYESNVKLRKEHLGY